MKNELPNDDRNQKSNYSLQEMNIVLRMSAHTWIQLTLQAPTINGSIRITKIPEKLFQIINVQQNTVHNSIEISPTSVYPLNNAYYFCLVCDVM